jgi:D-alanine transaminase
MPELASVNGKICPLREAVIPAEDRGFLFGDGVYEVLRSYSGHLWSSDLHFQRLERSLSEIGITRCNLTQIRHWVEEAYRQCDLPEALVYFQITRGAGPRSHIWPEEMTPTFFLSVRPFPPRIETRQNGASAVILPDQRWGRCDIKSINLLPNILAKHKARQLGAYEAILAGPDGRLHEGSSCAVFWINHDILYTPPLSTAILPSITRQIILEMAARLEIPACEQEIPARELASAEEVFIASTGDEITGIIQIDGNLIGTGTPGKLTRQLQIAFQNLVFNQSNEGKPPGDNRPRKSMF